MKLKKSLALLLTLIISLPLASSNVLSAEGIGIVIDGNPLTLSSQAMIENSRTLVPLRGVFEELGATVDWNQATGQAIIKTDDIEVLMSPEETSVLLNGHITVLDAPAKNVDGHLLVPIRFVAEALGHDVDWDPDARNVLIRTNPDTKVVESQSLPMVNDRNALESLLSYSKTLNNYIDFGMGTMDVLEESEVTSNDLALDDRSESAPAAESESLNSAGSDYSDTNNQVEGVDEGDLVKTDGEHIVLINNNTVKIIDPSPKTPEVLSEIYIPRGRGYVSNIYLNNDQVILLGSSYVQYGLPELMLPEIVSSRPMTYYTSNTFLLVYDISTPSSPELIMDMDYEGTYVSSRLVGNDFYMVTQKQLDYWSIGSLTDYEIQPKYANNLTDVSTVIPYDQINYFPDYVAPSIMMTIGIDLESLESPFVKAYLGSADTIYATTTTMYLAFTHYEYAKQLTSLIYTPSYTKSTALYKFTLEDGNINYTAKGSVPGSVLNQFSLDAYKGYLRIATSTGDMWDTSNPSKNNVYILDASMEEVGALTDLAPGERIYSTRFYEDRIYMVTFKQVDPLFVIDAQDPTKPELLGYLKVPGFSTYMHLLDKNHLLGFGTETYEVNGTTRTGGIKLSLFDVTDPYSPIESKVEVIGVSGSYSQIQYDHKALMISLDKGIMAFPLSVAANTSYSTDFVGAYIYDIDNSSFDYRGNVVHKTIGDYATYGAPISRLIYIGDYLYSFSDNEMVVSELANLEAVGSLTFESSTKYDLPIIEPTIE